MKQEKNNLPIVASSLSRYICIYIYPAIYTVLFYYFDNLHPILYFYSDNIDLVFWGAGILFVPAILWFLATKLIEKIHPIVTIIYFSLFVLIQLVNI